MQTHVNMFMIKCIHWPHFATFYYIYVLKDLKAFLKAITTMNQPTNPNTSGTSQRQAQSPFTLAASGRMPEERVNECHLALTKFIVKGLHPFATVESNCFR